MKESLSFSKTSGPV